LPHLLEFTAHPQQVIHEAWNTLTPEGHLIILGFNPWSLNNLRHVFNRGTIDLPQTAKFHSANKIHQWLKDSHYEIIYSRHFFYLPFSTRNETLNKWASIEKIAPWLLPNCGGIYVMAIKKRTWPLTPLQSRWSWRELLYSKTFAEPATRNIYHE
jgi:SAM-dependent methyltransferase